jgi:chemotaxis protein MotB
MATETTPAPIIVIKKKKHGGGHHGGAWKVAYADFVTAMMALFIVLWLLSSSEQVKKAVGGYFQDPTGSGKQMGSTLAGAGEGINLSPDDMSKLKDKLEQAMREIPKFQKMKDQINITVTGEGLRVELMETSAGMFFDSGKPNPSETGRELLTILAAELGKLPNRLLIEGHTDSKPFNSDRDYSNWELSADRANAARRLMQEHGLRPDQVGQVRGFADQSLRKSRDPENPSNRRISVIVQYRSASDRAHAADGKATAGAVPEATKGVDHAQTAQRSPTH